MRILALSLGVLGCAHASASHTVAPAYHIAGNGPKCLVIPGGPGLEWRYLRMPELEKRLTLIYVEPRPASLPESAAQIDELRLQLGLGRACIIGHDTGAVIAEQLAVTHPDHLSIMVIYGGLSHSGREWIEEMLANLRWFENPTWYNEASKALLEEDPKTDAEATESWHKQLPLYFADYDSNREAYDAAAKVNAKAVPSMPVFDFRGQLQKITALTLVLVGQKDFRTPVSHAREIDRGIQGAQLEVFEKSGHMIHIEEPARFAQVVGDFVERAVR